LGKLRAARRRAGFMTPLLQVQDLKTQFFTGEGVARAVDDVSFELSAGEILGIVGESGCGKTVTALSIMRLLDPPGRVVAGRVLFDGRDLLELRPRAMAGVRGGEIAMIFQQPKGSS
jgi:peptide/nickel transport system ATP-binding protein